MAINVLPVEEDDKAHRSGCGVDQEVTARAEVNLSRPPKLSVFTAVLDPSGKGLTKLPRSVISLALELYRGLDTPSASGTLDVFWHPPEASAARMARQNDSCYEGEVTAEDQHDNTRGGCISHVRWSYSSKLPPFRLEPESVGGYDMAGARTADDQGSGSAVADPCPGKAEPWGPGRPRRLALAS